MNLLLRHPAARAPCQTACRSFAAGTAASAALRVPHRRFLATAPAAHSQATPDANTTPNKPRRFSPLCGSPACHRRGFLLHCRTPLHRGDFLPDCLTYGSTNLIARSCFSTFLTSHAVRRNASFTCSLVPPGSGGADHDDNAGDAPADTPPGNAEAASGVDGEGSILHVDGHSLLWLRPDDRCNIALMRRAFGHGTLKSRRQKQAKPGQNPDPADGAVEGMSLVPGHGIGAALRQAVASVSEGAPGPATVVMLDEGGVSLQGLVADRVAERGGQGSAFPGGVVFVLGDGVGLTQGDVASARLAAQREGAEVVTASLGDVSLMTSQCITVAHYILDSHHSCGWKVPESGAGGSH